jgi:hypothetical protein
MQEWLEKSGVNDNNAAMSFHLKWKHMKEQSGSYLCPGEEECLLELFVPCLIIFHLSFSTTLLPPALTPSVSRWRDLLEFRQVEGQHTCTH